MRINESKHKQLHKMKTKEEIKSLLGNYYTELSTAKLSKEVIFVHDNYTDIFYNLQMAEKSARKVDLTNMLREEHLEMSTQSESEINEILQHQQPNLDPVKYNPDDLQQMTEIQPKYVYEKSELLPQPICPKFELSTDLAKQIIRERYDLPENTLIEIQQPK